MKAINEIGTSAMVIETLFRSRCLTIPSWPLSIRFINMSGTSLLCLFNLSCQSIGVSFEKDSHRKGRSICCHGTAWRPKGLETPPTDKPLLKLWRLRTFTSPHHWRSSSPSCFSTCPSSRHPRYGFIVHWGRERAYRWSWILHLILLHHQMMLRCIKDGSIGRSRVPHFAM